MTRVQLRESMSNQEFIEWRAFYKWENAMNEMEMRKAAKGRTQ